MVKFLNDFAFIHNKRPIRHPLDKIEIMADDDS